MKPGDFHLLAGIVEQRSGLALTNDKAYLLESRLPPVARKWGLKTIDELIQAARTKRDESMLNDITEAMMTKDTMFYRDWRSFELLHQTLLPRFIQSRAAKKQLRIWSAATASGQEAYSLALLCAEEAALLKGWTIDIDGTDLSSTLIERAKSGLYTHFEAQRGLPITMLIKYFQPAGDKWQIRDEIRQMVRFRTGNLLHDFGPVGVFDVIFCRNVLSHFNPPARTRVLNALAAVLAPDGALFLGADENLFGGADKFKPANSEGGFYVPAGAPLPVFKQVG